MLPRTQRLTKTREFQKVFRQGNTIRGQGVVLKLKASSADSASRFAVVVSKKVAQKAVRRNRIRRLLTEAIQNSAEISGKGFDAVLVVLPGFRAQTLQEAQTILTQLFQRADILQSS